MARVSDSDIEQMTQGEIIKQMMTLLTVLGKKEKTSSKLLEKVETKKMNSAPPKEVRPIQLDKSTAWVEFVHKHILTNGWEAFHHTERFGNGKALIKYPESELVPLLDEDGKECIDEDGAVNYAYVFKASVTPSNPSGDQPTKSHAMTLSKNYWSPTKNEGSKPHLYVAFEQQYVSPEMDCPKQEKHANLQVILTLDEKKAEKAKRQAEKEAEKLKKKVEREAKKAERDAEREAEKLRKKAEKEAKIASKVPKSAAKAIKTTVKSTIPVPKRAQINDDWVPPSEGKSKPFTLNGVIYLRQSNNIMWTRDDAGEPDDVIGIYDPTTQTISEEIPKEILNSL